MKSRGASLLAAVMLSLSAGFILAQLIKEAAALVPAEAIREKRNVRSESPARQEIVTASIPVAGVSITGPIIGSVGIVYTYTAVITPLDASPPIRYAWSPAPTAGQRQVTANYIWSAPGKQIINVTAYNRTGSATASYTVTVSGPITPVLAVDISGPTLGILNRSDTFTAFVSPLDATPPIVYIWSPTPTLGQYTSNATFTWKSLGDTTIMVTATNAGGSGAKTHHIIIENVPVERVVISGTSTMTAALYQSSSFTAIISPTVVSLPITYTWMPTPTNGQYSATATYTWDTIGTTAVTVMAENPGGSATDTRNIVVVPGPQPAVVHLPVILHRWPPLPSVPQLNPIENTGGGHNYTVIWSTAELAEAYILEEATDNAFVTAMEVYSGPGNSYVVSGNGPARYYYRVKARNSWGDNGWSNIRSVDVLWELEPNTYIYQSNGPLLSGINYHGYPDIPNADNPYPWDCFYFDANNPGLITLDLTNHVGQGVQLLLYYQTYADLKVQDYNPPYHIAYTGVAGRYYTCIYSESAYTNEIPYTLQITFP